MSTAARPTCRPQGSSMRALNRHLGKAGESRARARTRGGRGGPAALGAFVLVCAGIRAVPADAQGGVGTESIPVVLDTVALRVLIDSPVNGFTPRQCGPLQATTAHELSHVFILRGQAPGPTATSTTRCARASGQPSLNSA